MFCRLSHDACLLKRLNGGFRWPKRRAGNVGIFFAESRDKADMHYQKILDDPGSIAEPPFFAKQVRYSLEKFPNSSKVALDVLREIDLEMPERGLLQESLAYGVLQGSAEHADWLAARTRAIDAIPRGEVRVARVGNMIDILLDRPVAHNAIDRGMRDRLFEVFTVAALDPEVTSVRLGGKGRAFCVGADLAEFGTTRDPATAHAIRMQTLPAWAIIGCANKLEVHVQGACIGSGLEMAAFAKRLTASPNAWFQLPELKMGLIPGAGGCVSVPSRIGRKRAALLLLSGNRISAQVALEWKLIDAIVDDPPFDHRYSDIVG
jgi:enoyl-CoA hydratase/carnithine racemase